MKHKAASFPPISTPASRVLILGSMPGIRSLDARQYYAHPQNAFWPVMGKLLAMPVETYAQRIRLIEESGLALWDVLKYCERRGSLDMRIDNTTIEVNDFESFFRLHPRVRHVFFNGQKAEQEFRRRVMPELPGAVKLGLVLARLPSTSPAMASLNKASKARAWGAVRRALGLRG